MAIDFDVPGHVRSRIAPPQRLGVLDPEMRARAARLRLSARRSKAAIEAGAYDDHAWCEAVSGAFDDDGFPGGGR